MERQRLLSLQLSEELDGSSSPGCAGPTTIPWVNAYSIKLRARVERPLVSMSILGENLIRWGASPITKSDLNLFNVSSFNA